MKFSPDVIPIEKLLLDPNNYRFYDLPKSQWNKKEPDRFHEPAVQQATLTLLENTKRYNLPELRESMLANGFVPMERIVVVEYENADDLYLVVEANRRIASLKTLLRDHEIGVITLSDEQKADYSNVPVALLDPEDNGIIEAERVVKGLRHIAGPQAWGAYQQAYLILELYDEEGQSFEDIAKHLGISLRETGRRYRAIRALRQMEDDDLYAGVAKPEFYRLFHELVSLPIVREFFSWDQTVSKFNNEEKSGQVFELIEPLEDDSTSKLTTYKDVRDLRFIIGNKQAEAILLDPEENLAAALTAAMPEPDLPTPSLLPNRIKDFFKALENAGIEELTALAIDDVNLLEDLAELISSRLEQHTKLLA